MVALSGLKKEAQGRCESGDMRPSAPRSLDHALAQIMQRAAGYERFIIALAGPPGAGKSTLARILANRLGDAGILQADGFHFDNLLLDRLGLRHRKGAVDTFDIAGLGAMLRRIRAREPVVMPVFDRELDVVRGCAELLPAATKFVVVEGNYLGLTSGPWAALRGLFDLTAVIDVPETELRRRLTRRWRDLGCSPADVIAHVEGNDLPNAALIRNNSQGDVILQP
ncbi:nucleoside/nucleotide kinase family protein [Xinfangfangia sp. CPCC 101601]|uniref:Nucleoside/nucleotide kinase family protein n=1 Tax=Pseudogemmobacter lacusdianii TaxID=3069608 RepID=A0ABU0VWM9_9RHOB|nr:nucleoside/nucleotide kinase family protein [Xinfangfangia sp. CPCC 101601]MDQ2066147.1 nucleoside/nucleotide kinase family protein [Xinfangfangia sp. CPCC 101601]